VECATDPTAVWRTTGHVWHRVRDWVEPDEAADFINAGVNHLVQPCQSPPRRGGCERFKRDVSAEMINRDRVGTFEGKSRVPTVMVSELWRSARDGYCLVLIERGPNIRHTGELNDDWYVDAHLKDIAR
jgi:hypothetical protein